MIDPTRIVDESVDVEARAIMNALVEQLATFLKAQQERDPLVGRIVELYWGLDGDEPHSVSDIAQICGMSFRRAGRLLRVGMAQLRDDFGIDSKDNTNSSLEGASTRSLAIAA